MVELAVAGVVAATVAVEAVPAAAVAVPGIAAGEEPAAEEELGVGAVRSPSDREGSAMLSLVVREAK